MTFEEWGATLRAEREKRHFTIEDVANELKINPRQIRALEEGDVASLPHQAYARGFIRSYASWLGMGAQEIHDGLENLGMPRPVQTPPQREAVQEDVLLPEPETSRKKSGGGRGLAVFALLCAIAGGIYFAWDTGYFDGFLSSFTSSAKNDDKLQSADTYMAARDQEDAVKAEKQKQEEHAGGSAIATSAPMPGNASETVIAPIPGAGPGNAADYASAGIQAAKRSADGAEPEKIISGQEAAPQTPDQHKLIITATEECWVHSNADKTDTRQFSLRKGDTFALAFSKSLELKLGNAGGVNLRYDGVDLPPAGTSGQVRTIRFPPENQ